MKIYLREKEKNFYEAAGRAKYIKNKKVRLSEENEFETL